MRPSRGAVPVPPELTADDGASSSTSLQRFNLRDDLVIAAPESGDWTQGQLDSLKEEGFTEVSERRFWHKAYMTNFPSPLPHHQGHRPAILQNSGVDTNFLLASDNPATVPRAAFMSRDEINRRQSDMDWAGKRDQLLAVSAAGVHGVNFLVHWMNLQWRYLDHKYAPQHEHIYTQFGKW